MVILEVAASPPGPMPKPGYVRYQFLYQRPRGLVLQWRAMPVATGYILPLPLVGAYSSPERLSV